MRVQHEPILQENASEKEDELLRSPRWHTAGAADGRRQKNQYPLGGHCEGREKLILCFTALLGYVKYCGYYLCVVRSGVHEKWHLTRRREQCLPTYLLNESGRREKGELQKKLIRRFYLCCEFRVR